MIDLKSRVVETLEAFNSLEPSWNELLSVSGSDLPFLTHEWLESYWRHLCKGIEPFVLVFEKGSEVVGLVPLTFQKVGLLRVLRFLGGYHADYQDVIIAADVRDEAFDLFLDKLHRIGNRWDVIDLRKIREDSPNKRHLERLLGCTKDRSLIHHEVSPFIEIGSTWSEYVGMIRKKLMKDTERQRKRLERLGDLSHKHVDTQGEIDGIIDIYHRQKESRIYRDTVARNTLGSREGRNFLCDFTHRAYKMGWLALDYLSLGGTDDPLAISISLCYRNSFYYWLPSINSQYLTYSPGRILLVSLLQESFNRGLTEFDFLNGGESYKYQWLAKDRKLYRLSRYSNGLKGVMWKGWVEGLRPRLRRSGLLTYTVRWTKKMLETGTRG